MNSIDMALSAYSNNKELLKALTEEESKTDWEVISEWMEPRPQVAPTGRALESSPKRWWFAAPDLKAVGLHTYGGLPTAFTKTLFTKSKSVFRKSSGAIYRDVVSIGPHATHGAPHAPEGAF